MPKDFGLSHISFGKINAQMDEGRVTHTVTLPIIRFRTMRRTLIYHLLVFLLLVLLIVFVSLPFDDQMIVITIVIPRNLIPYYDWLLNFPGWKVPHQSEPLPTIPTYYGCQSVSHICYSMTFITLFRNIV
jgi:hypothetical protein